MGRAATTTVLLCVVSSSLFGAGCVTSKDFKLTSAAMKESTGTTPTILSVLKDTEVAATSTMIQNQKMQLRELRQADARAAATYAGVEDSRKVAKDVKDLASKPGIDILADKDDGDLSVTYGRVAQIIADRIQAFASFPKEPVMWGEAETAAAKGISGTLARLSELPRDVNEFIGYGPAWQVYAIERSFEPFSDAALGELSERYESAVARGREVARFGAAVDRAVQASWDRDDVLKVLDLAAGLAALAAVLISIGAH